MSLTRFRSGATTTETNDSGRHATEFPTQVSSRMGATDASH